MVRVVADCAYSRSGEGLHRFTDPVDKQVYLYSDLETFDAHRIYACFDQPDMKATYELTVTAPEDWQVVSNMAPDSQLPAGDAVRWTFPPTPVMSTYITAVAAGPYHVVRDEHDGIPLGVYCRQSLAEYLDPDEIFEVTRQGFDFFHNSFGIKYPFGKYDQLFVPEFKEGAMENAGCVTFVENYIFRSRVTDFAHEARAETILHEMAHMWFGDLVTMRWWDDLWLNESFATWAGTLAQAEATRWTSAWTTFAQLYKAWAYRQDQLPSTHPIAADIPDIAAVELNFDGITYAKGAAVLKQLVAYVGRENFLDGVRKYFAAHAWGNATLADLLAALEETSGRDLAAWSAEWLQQAGVNTLRPSYQVDADGRFTEFAVEQEAAATHPTLRSHRIAIGLYDRTADGIVRRHRVETDVTGARTVIAELAGAAAPRPGAGERRGPHLRQDPARRALAAHAGGLDRRLHRLAARGAVLVRRLGHVPRRRDGGARLRAAGAVRHLLGGRHQRGADPAAAGQRGDTAAGRPRLAADRAGPDGQHAARPARRGAGRLGCPARLRPGLRRGGHQRRGPGPAGRAARRLGGARRPRGRHRPALGPAVPAGQPGRRRLRPRSGSRRSSTGTPPTRASGTPRRAGRPSPPPRPSRRPGTRWSRASRRWPRSAPPCPGSSTWTSRR